MLAAVLAAMGLASTILYWLSVRDTSASPLSKVLEARISKLQIDREGVSTVLEKEGDSWRMTSPTRDSVDSNPVSDILNALLGVRIGAEASSDPGSYPDYAVHEASATRLRLYTADSAAPVFDGFFGRAALGYDSLYLRLAALKPVYLASGVAPYQLDRKPDEFRERDITRVDRATLEAISLRAEGRDIEIRRSTSGFTVSGIEASPDKVETAVDRILGLRVSDFADAADTRAGAGLDRPGLEISIRGTARSTRLLVGKSKPGPKGVTSPYRFAEVSGRSALLLLSAADLESIVDLLGARATAGRRTPLKASPAPSKR